VKTKQPSPANKGTFGIEKYVMTQERWKAIQESKKRFLEDKNYDPRDCSYMNPCVATSLLRCRKMGLNPYQSFLGHRLKPDEFSIVLEENRLLIDITKPLVNTFKNLAISTGYGLYLTNNKGVFLLHEGECLSMQTDDNPLVGMLWDEKTVGTTAHSLSILYQHPVQLIGAENYSQALKNVVASAAPILGYDGKVIATLVLAQVMIDEPWKDNYQKLCSNTLGLITAISTAVESQLKLQKSFSTLKMANETLEATLALIDEGIITIDRRGTIMYSNEEGRRIFKLKPDQVGQKCIREFLRDDSRVMALVEKGESVTIEETINRDQEDERYIINIQSIMDKDTLELDVALLTINPAGKVNVITTNRAGAVARFFFRDIIGKSDVFNKALIKAQFYAKTSENILLIGESGTGKELFAQAIHNQYNASGPFIAVNCAALPRELVESELFGYEGGSFTGADRSGRPGKIELAEGGTLFLDEIGDMPLELQGVLLRVLEDKHVMRIGGKQYKKVNFRVIAATNQNLRKMVKEKLFREDLYYRLSVLAISIPPLRERNGDSEILANYFIKKYSKRMGKKTPNISLTVLEMFRKYEWPGNVRELENAMAYAVINGRLDFIEPADLPEDILLKFDFEPPVEFNYNKNIDVKMDGFPSLTTIEKNAISQALSKAEGNAILAACLLGISKSTIYRKLKEYGIRHK